MFYKTWMQAANSSCPCCDNSRCRCRRAACIFMNVRYGTVLPRPRPGQPAPTRPFLKLLWVHLVIDLDDDDDGDDDTTTTNNNKICNKNMHVYHHTCLLCWYHTLYKLWSTYPCLHCFNKWPFYCVQQVCQVPSNLTIFSRHVPEEFCNESFTSLSPPNLALCVATVPCKASNNLTACQSRSAC